MSDDRPSRYEEDGKVIYRASSLGSCLKSQVAMGMGMTGTFPDWLLVKFQQGIDGEPVALDMIRDCWRLANESDHQYQWHDGQIMVEIPIGNTLVLRGHLDGVGVCYRTSEDDGYTLGDKRVVEVKCVSTDYARVISDNLPVMYQYQISAYGNHFGMGVLLVLGVKDRDGKVVNVATQMIDEMPFTMGQVKARVVKVENCVQQGVLPDCDYRQYPCQTPWLCDEPWTREATPDELLLETLQESIVMVENRKKVVAGAEGKGDGAL